MKKMGLRLRKLLSGIGQSGVEREKMCIIVWSGSQGVELNSEARNVADSITCILVHWKEDERT